MSPSPFYDRQRAEYAAGVESAMQVARWSIPVDLARQATEEVLQHPGALPFDGLTISGDHRPRHPGSRGRLTLDDVAAYRENEGLPPSALWLWIRHPRQAFTDEHVIPCLACGAEIRLAFGPDLERRRAAAMQRHLDRDPTHAPRTR